MKQGNSTIDANALASGRGLSSGSPSVAPVWSTPTTVKTSVGSAASYIPSYTSWYPTAHQESMQPSQLMWSETSAFDSAVDRASALSGRSQALHTDGTQQQQLRRFDAASWHSGFIPEDENRGRDRKDCRDAQYAQGQHVPDTQRKPSTNGSFTGCSSSPFCPVSVPVLNVIAFNFLFPQHPFVMPRPAWRWPQISPRLLTADEATWEEGILNQISGLHIPPSGCWNHCPDHARPQPASMLFICIFYLI